MPYYPCSLGLRGPWLNYQALIICGGQGWAAQSSRDNEIAEIPVNVRQALKMELSRGEEIAAFIERLRQGEAEFTDEESESRSAAAGTGADDAEVLRRRGPRRPKKWPEKPKTRCVKNPLARCTVCNRN